MAYNSANGVCFEAIKDIKAGEELMALFDSLKGTVIVESYLGKSGGEGEQKNERRWSRKFHRNSRTATGYCTKTSSDSSIIDGSKDVFAEYPVAVWLFLWLLFNDAYFAKISYFASSGIFMPQGCRMQQYQSHWLF